MIDFKPISIDDREWAYPILRTENSKSADYVFGNIYMWAKLYDPHLAKLGERLITRMIFRGAYFYTFPVGSGALHPAIEAMKKDACERGTEFALRGITWEHRELLEREYPGRFQFIEMRDSYDYIYTVEKLAMLAGRKLHGKRNHCNRFERENDWDFLPLTPELIPACIAMLDEWIKEYGGYAKGIEGEREAILRGFNAFDRLGLEGGVLRSSGRVVGFTVGERANVNTYDVHFEKAFSSINGAYPMVSREFARQIQRLHPDIEYINREEDMGLPNLRKAKQDFYPDILLEKYTVLERCPQ
jgi:hypothetical protein